MGVFHDVMLLMVGLGLIKQSASLDQSSLKRLPLTSPEGKNLLKPAIENVAKTTNHLTSVTKELVGLSLNMVELVIAVPAQVITRALQRVKQKTGTLNERQTGQFLQTVNDMPSSLPAELEQLWEDLLVHSVSNDYHPIHSRILSELSTAEAILLESLIAMTLDGKPIVPARFTAAEIPKAFFNRGKVRKERLAVSLTVLERQKLIATSNNLGTYFARTNKKHPATLNPIAHQVTPLGLALHRACNPSFYNKTYSRPPKKADSGGRSTG